jgi:hypothetical protein
MVKPERVRPVPIEKFPIISDELMQAIRSRFAYSPPHPQDTERNDLYSAGRESVLEFLEHVSRSQSKPR